MIAIIDPKNTNPTSISSHLLLQNKSPNPTKKSRSIVSPIVSPMKLLKLDLIPNMIVFPYSSSNQHKFSQNNVSDQMLMENRYKFFYVPAILYQNQQNNKMNRHTRVYESGQVQFDNCACIARYLPKGQESSFTKIQVRRQKPIILNQPIMKDKQKMKAIGLRLAKNIPLTIANDGRDRNRAKLTARNPPNSHPQNQQTILKTPDKKVTQNNPQQPDPSENIYGTIVQSRLIKNQCMIKKSSTIENGRKSLNRKFMKDTGLFNDSPQLSTHVVAGKVTSTSSTTLFQTKLNFEEISKQGQFLQHGHHPIRDIGKQAKNQQQQIQNNSQILFSITDFSRVRKVQTVMSEQSDSFDISFLDIASQLENEQLQEMQKEIKLGEIHQQIKTLLN